MLCFSAQLKQFLVCFPSYSLIFVWEFVTLYEIQYKYKFTSVFFKLLFDYCVCVCGCECVTQMCGEQRATYSLSITWVLGLNSVHHVGGKHPLPNEPSSLWFRTHQFTEERSREQKLRYGWGGREEERAGHVTERQLVPCVLLLFVFVGGFGLLTEGFYLSVAAFVCYGFWRFCFLRKVCLFICISMILLFTWREKK